MSYENYRPTGYKMMPEVIKNLLIINGIMFLATIVLLRQGINLNDLLGLHYFASEKFRIYQLITYMFMHDSSGIMHIFFNMLALYMFGSAVENVWGGKRFLTFYLLTGLGAAFTHYAIVYFQMQPEISFFHHYISATSSEDIRSLITNDAYKNYYSNAFAETVQSNSLSLTESKQYAQDVLRELLNAPVIIGASGAVYGVLLAYGMLFPNSLLYFFFAIPIRAKYVVVIYGLISLFSGIQGGDNVAHFAHLGGLFTGIIIILYWRKRNKIQRNNFYDES